MSITSGESFYTGLEGGFKSKGVKQRVHETKIQGDHLFILVDRSKGGTIESDRYAPLASMMEVKRGLFDFCIDLLPITRMESLNLILI